MKFLSTLLLVLLASSVPCPAEIETGFESLLDGQSLAGWSHNGNWAFSNGVVTRVGRGGPLTYEKATVPDDFELRFEWKVAKGCNSGVYYRPGQYEYQLLDNANSSYGENPRSCAGALFFCQAPTKDVVRPFDTWNEGRILCKGTVIQHWLNGEKVVDFDYADPRWADAVKLVGYRGTDLSKRGGKLWLQDHGAEVSFRNLRWRSIPADEAVISENLTPMPVPEAALKKEQERIQQLLETRQKKAASKAKLEELQRFPAQEARQGVAVDASHFYAITNAAIGKYRRDDGSKVGEWKEDHTGRLKHLNAGLVLEERLYCAHSNYPTIPMESSVEIWDTATLHHRQTIPLTRPEGSLTWIDQHNGFWYACFAQYAKTGNPADTRILQFDLDWKPTGREWRFPDEAVKRFGQNSASGGSFGPGGRLFVTGHDAAELYVLGLPDTGAELSWMGLVPITTHGQAFAWDRAEETRSSALLFSIERKTSEVVVARLWFD